MSRDPDDALASITANVTVTNDTAIDLAAISRRVVWVGGRIALSTEHLMFAANRANRVVNRTVPGSARPPMDFGIGLRDIDTVTLRTTKLRTKTIEIRLATGDTKIGIRCRRAAEFAARIDEQRAALHD